MAVTTTSSSGDPQVSNDRLPDARRCSFNTVGTRLPQARCSHVHRVDSAAVATSFSVLLGSCTTKQVDTQNLSLKSGYFKSQTPFSKIGSHMPNGHDSSMKSVSGTMTNEQNSSQKISSSIVNGGGDHFVKSGFNTPDARRRNSRSHGRRVTNERGGFRRTIVRGLCCQQDLWHAMLLVAMICVAFLATTSVGFKCHSYDDNSLAEILPRDDIVRHVDDRIKVFCHYDSAQLNGSPVQFERLVGGNRTILESKRENSSLISTVLEHSDTDAYNLYCFSDTSPRPLCIRRVTVGYKPEDVVGFSCESPNWEKLICSWTRPVNKISTRYNFSYLVPLYKPLSHISTNKQSIKFTLDITDSPGSRQNITILINARNSLGEMNFSHHVDIYEVVIPSTATSLSMSNASSSTVNVTWRLDHKMDSFPGQLKQEVSWRIVASGDLQAWDTTIGVAQFTMQRSNMVHNYYQTLELPYANTLYEIRVRMHTAAGSLNNDTWSTPAYVNVTTLSKLPEQVAATDISSFEVSNFLLSREVFVYWQQLTALQHSADGFYYRIEAYYADDMTLVKQMPTVSQVSYARFTNLSSTRGYRFRITAVNDIGSGQNSTEVFVPKKSDLPDTPAMFTVIKYKNPMDELSPLYRLMWKPPANVNESRHRIVGYTLFWCPSATYDTRCEENLMWESAGESLSSLSFKDQKRAELYQLPQLYERNMTGLPQRRQFGIAAVTDSGVSSGIKWATCSVPYDNSPPAPNKPYAAIQNARSAKINWKFECPDKAAVPLAVNITYCEVQETEKQLDFSNCITPVDFVEHGLEGPALILELRPSSTVIFSLSVLTVVGASRHSLPVKLRMWEDVPDGAPEFLSVLSHTNTTATIKWGAPDPLLSNGRLTSYELSLQPYNTVKMYSATEALQEISLLHLSPFTRYNVSVAACTAMGCAVSHPATATFLTSPGIPKEVDMMSVNIVDRKVTWAFDEENCHSASCSFDLEIQYNQTTYREYGITENYLNLNEFNITCSHAKKLTVSLRAVGEGLNGSLLAGPWNTKEDHCTAQVFRSVAWWVIAVVVIVCMLGALAVFVITKCGLNVFKQITKPINVPKLTVELKSAGGSDKKQLQPRQPQQQLQQQQHPQQQQQQQKQQQGVAVPEQGFKHPSYTVLHNKQRSSPVGGVAAVTYDENKKIPLLSQTSQSSEIDPIEDDGDRHGRNLSGDSSRSSGGSSALSSEADSALASTVGAHDTSSAGSADSEDSESRFLRQSREQWPGSNLRQRSPGPYVMHGERPHKNISEGYVAVRSHPSLVGDLTSPVNRRNTPVSNSTSPSNNASSNNNSANGMRDNGTNNLQRSTPNLLSNNPGGSQPSLASMKTPSTSAGYFSTTESDPAGDEISALSGLPQSRSGFGHSVNSGINSVAPPYSNAVSPFPIYSRHSFTPPGKQKPSTGVNDHNGRNSLASSDFGDLKYVAVAFNNNDNDSSRLSTPESFTGLFESKRRPPSLHSALSVGQGGRKNSIPEDLMDANSAYSVVGSRKINIQPVPSSQGYVTLSNAPRVPTNNVHPSNTNNNSRYVSSPPSLLSNIQPSQKNTSESTNPYYTVGESNEIMNNISSPTRITGSNSSASPNTSNINSSNGYVTLGDQGFQSNSTNPSLPGSANRDPGIESNSSSARSHYVTAAPNVWAFHTSRPEPVDSAEEVRFVASAPSENLRGRFKDSSDANLSPQLSERPSTSDGVVSRPKRLSQSPSSNGWPTGAPSLSKQSSGYVSQEALGFEPLVMSPKRLVTQNMAVKPMKSDPHEVSFV